METTVALCHITMPKCVNIEVLVLISTFFAESLIDVF